MKKVSFSITGEFITEHARNLWMEGQYRKSYDVLSCLIGTTREQHDLVLQGRMRFTGVNDVFLVEDNWTPPKDYPTVGEVLDRATDYPELRERREDEAIRLVSRAFDISTFMTTGREAEERDRLLSLAGKIVGMERAMELFQRENDLRQEHKGAVSEPVERDDEIPDRGAVPEMGGLEGAAARAQEVLKRMAMRKEGFDPEALPTPEAMLKRGVGIKPKLCPDMSSASGWLLRDGKFYGCGTMEHVGLAESLLPDRPNGMDAEAYAEKLGWIKLARSFTGFHCIGYKKLTKAQENKLWVYAQYHKRDYEQLVSNLRF